MMDVYFICEMHSIFFTPFTTRPLSVSIYVCNGGWFGEHISCACVHSMYVNYLNWDHLCCKLSCLHRLTFIYLFIYFNTHEQIIFKKYIRILLSKRISMNLFEILDWVPRKLGTTEIAAYGDSQKALSTCIVKSPNTCERPLHNFNRNVFVFLVPTFRFISVMHLCRSVGHWWETNL